MSLSLSFSVITSKKPFNVKISKLSGFLLKFDIILNESFNNNVFSFTFFQFELNNVYLFLHFYSELLFGKLF